MVGVVNHRGRPALSNRHDERIKHDRRFETRLHGPAYNPLDEDVQHDREIEEAGLGGDVVDVRDPELVRRRRDERAIHEIVGTNRGRIATRGHLKPPARDALQALLAEVGQIGDMGPAGLEPATVGL
jgi:hypothetical protein